MAGQLTPKQALFIGQYLADADRNATRAAIAAGVPERSAAVTASRWMKSPKVAAAIQEGTARIEAKLEVKAERVLRELAKLAFYDPRDLFDEKGQLKKFTELDEITRAAVAGLDVETREFEGEGPVVQTYVKKFKLADKGQNLERLGRYLKLFTDRVEHDGRVTLEQLVSGQTEAA